MAELDNGKECVKSVSVFDGLAVVSKAKAHAEILFCPNMVQPKGCPQFCGCFVLPAPRALGRKNLNICSAILPLMIKNSSF